MDREDIEILFRCLMQFLRHLAKKYGFKIKQYPENAEIAERNARAKEEARGAGILTNMVNPEP
jgi:hypothetical protein